MERMVYVNGEIVPDGRAVVSVHDKGFVYGDAVFDTLRTFAGRPHRAEAHVARLYESLRYVRIPPPMTEPEMMAVLDRVIEANRPALPEGEDWWVTVRVSSGLAAMDGAPPPRAGPTVVVECVPLPLRARAGLFRDGVAMTLSHRPRIAPEALSPKAKTTNYMNMILAQREVEAIAPGTWALMPDARGNLAEGPGCNLFVVKGGRVATPGPDYILEGVTRAEAIDLCREIGLEIVECDLSLHAALNADEAFLTSTSLCICPVRAIDGAAFPGAVPGPVTRRLMEAYKARVGFDYEAQYLAHLGNAAARTGL